MKRMEDYGRCAKCGRRFLKYRPYQKYCSTKCRNVTYKLKYSYIKNEIATKECKQCGKEFKTNISSKHYCSSLCQKINQAKSYTKITKRKIECPICGFIFETAHQHKKYCSTTCYAEAKKERK